MIYWVNSCDYSLLEAPWSKLLILLDLIHFISETLFYQALGLLGTQSPYALGLPGQSVAQALCLRALGLHLVAITKKNRLHHL